MRVAFWVSLGVVGWVYVAYPALLIVWARFGRGGWRSAQPGDVPPSVSVIVAARNEATRLGARVENLLALEYPPNLVEVIVVSDGSTDDTTGVLAPFADRIRIITLPPSGKAAALNVAAAVAQHDVLAFTDARQVFAPDALRHLVAPLADRSVGAVSGELVLDTERLGTAPRAGDSEVGEGVGLYWRFEKWLRRQESAVHSLLGATGAIWAIRRALWKPLPPDTILDDVLAPMRAVLAGSRVVFNPAARAFDRASARAAAETRRKVRTLAGIHQLLWLEPRLLVPVANPVWLQFLSHKVGRLAVPYALVVLAVSSAALAPEGAGYGAALAAQVLFYLLAMHGALTVGGARRVDAPARRQAPVDAVTSRKEWTRAPVD